MCRNFCDQFSFGCNLLFFENCTCLLTYILSVYVFRIACSCLWCIFYAVTQCKNLSVKKENYFKFQKCNILLYFKILFLVIMLYSFPRHLSFSVQDHLLQYPNRFIDCRFITVKCVCIGLFLPMPYWPFSHCCAVIQ